MAKSPSETYESILAGMRSRQREDEPSNFEKFLGVAVPAGVRIFNQVLEDRFNAFQQSEPVLASKQVARAANSNRAYWLQDLKKQEELGVGDLEYMTGVVREDVKNRLLQNRPEAATASFGFNELVEREARKEAEKYLKIRGEAIALAQKSPEDFEANIDLISRRLRPNSAQNLFDASIRGLFDGMSKEEAEQAQLASLAEYTKTDILPTEVPPGLTPTQLQARRARRLNLITQEYMKTRNLGYATTYADNDQAVQDLKDIKVTTEKPVIQTVEVDGRTMLFKAIMTTLPDESTRLGNFEPITEVNDDILEEVSKPQILDILTAAEKAFGKNSQGYENFTRELAANGVSLIGDRLPAKEYNKAVELFGRALTDPKRAKDFFGSGSVPDAVLTAVLNSGLKDLMETYDASMRSGDPITGVEMNTMSLRMGEMIKETLKGLGSQRSDFKPLNLYDEEIPYVGPVTSVEN